MWWAHRKTKSASSQNKEYSWYQVKTLNRHNSLIIRDKYSVMFPEILTQIEQWDEQSHQSVMCKEKDLKPRSGALAATSF